MQPRLLLSYLLSLALLVAIVAFIDVKQVLESVLAFGLLPSLTFMAVYGFSFFFRAVKWKYILKPFADVSLSDSYHFMMLGFFSNNLLPARIGEIIRAYALSKKYPIGKVKAFSTVVVDRVTDGTTLIGLFLVVFALAEKIPAGFQQLVVLPTVVFALLLAVFLFPNKVKRLLKPLVDRLPVLRAKADFLIAESVMGGRALRGNQRFKAAIWLSSMATWAIHVGVGYYAAQEMRLPLSLFDVGLLTALTGFAAMIPAAPGYIGTFEAAVAAFFVAYGLDVNQGIAYAVVIHVLQLLAIMVLGYQSMHHLGLKVGQVLAPENGLAAKDGNKLKGKARLK